MKRETTGNLRYVFISQLHSNMSIQSLGRTDSSIGKKSLPVGTEFAEGREVNVEEFERIKRLPPYVFPSCQRIKNEAQTSG